MDFVLSQPAGLEESLVCELKEVKSHPAQAIGRIVDEYVVAFLNEAGGSIYWGIRDSDGVVTGVPASDNVRDEIKRVIGQKVGAIAPHVPAAMVEVPFHAVSDSGGRALQDTFVVQVRVAKPLGDALYLTESGNAYRKTIGGTKKLSGAEFYVALERPLRAKVTKAAGPSLLVSLPGVYERAMLAQRLVRGRRVLWVDDQPTNTFYERLALGEIGLTVDVAVSSMEGLASARHLRPDVILSDMKRDGQKDAGIEFLKAARAQGVTTPIIYYIGEVDDERGVPPGAFGITNRPDEVLHLILDVLERGAGYPL